MKRTIQILNDLVKNKIINEYAIAGGMAHFYYIEPSVTYDLDLIVNLSVKGNPLAPSSDLYKWAGENKFQTENEHIVKVEYLYNFYWFTMSLLMKRC